MRVSLAMLLCAAWSTGCDDGRPALTPDVLAEGEVRGAELTVTGLHPSMYLVAFSELALRDDLAITIDDRAVEVVRVDPEGPRVRLAFELPPGRYRVDVRSYSAAWRDDALTVRSVADAGLDAGSRGVDAGLDAGVAVQDAAPDGGDASTDGGDASTDADAGPVDGGPPPAVAVRALAAGRSNSYEIRADGTLWGWGDNDGQLGQGDTVRRSTPVQIGVRSDWVAVAAGDQVLCAAAADGSVWCAGKNDKGQVGVGDTTRRTTLTLALAARTGPAAPRLSSFRDHVCAIDPRRRLFCWGDGNDGRLGHGDTADRLAPAQVGSASDWTSVGSGERDSCGVLDAGDLQCWGREIDSLQPTGVSGAPSGWTGVDWGNNHGCGIVGAGQLYCWGRNNRGQLGAGDTSDRAAPTRVGSRSDWIAVDVGQDLSCGITADGALHCWGEGNQGQTGQGDTTDRSRPTRVGARTDWALVATGHDHACALTLGDELHCWGHNDSGQLGLGDTTDRDVPTRVR